MTASKMLMNFPSRFLAVAFSSPSSCTTCCCCCCSSILEMRVWHASSASCGQEHILGHSSPQLLPHQPGQARSTIPTPHIAHALSSCPAAGAEEAVSFPKSEGRSPLPIGHCSLQYTPQRLDMEMPGWAASQLLPRRRGYPATWSLQLLFQKATQRTKVLHLARNLHPLLGCAFSEAQFPTAFCLLNEL